MIRVLIVDDSAVLRQTTKFMLESDSQLMVVGEAANGVDAITMAEQLRPDVITMDIRMPKMDGTEAIRQIMAVHPVPIVVVTSVDPERETGVYSQVSKLGAVAVLKRPEGIATPDYKSFAAKLVEQVKLMSSVKVIRRPYSVQPVRVESGGFALAAAPVRANKIEIVAIGSSTGGPAALHKVLAKLPADFRVPIVIVQHISFGFVEGLATWLDDACAVHVQVGRLGEKLRAGTVYIAPDEYHMVVDRLNRIALNPGEPVGGHRPSVTPLFQSVAASYGPSALGVILTGMGADGALGMKALSDAGAITLAQDEASCVVFGMPKEAIALGAVQHIVPLAAMAEKIQEFVQADA